MRLFLTAATAGLLLVPVTTTLPAMAACADLSLAALAATAQPGAAYASELSAAKKKKEKVEYMKSAAGPEPMPPKKKKKK